MQAGFTCLESGLVRKKNSFSVAVKNVADFCVSTLCFWAIGFALMFGVSANGLFGTSYFFFEMPDQTELNAFFLFQLVFCGAASTIVSGAVTERMRFYGYIIVTIIMASIIYPIVGHWTWSGNANINQSGWLQNLGFYDFAGSTVVHSVGGWVSLAAILVIGPRAGRFEKRQQENFEGQDLSISGLGVFLLFFGWLGFNGGSLFTINSQLTNILLNTILAGASGGLITLLYSAVKKEIPFVPMIFNGVLAGLVSITANCAIVSTPSAIFIGTIGGLISIYMAKWLYHIKIDDGIGVLSVHLGPGIWATLAVALFGHYSPISNTLDRWHLFQIQLLGVVSIGLFAFGTAFILLKMVNHFFNLRVSIDVEHIGLNVGEHQMPTELNNLVIAMENNLQHSDFSSHVNEDPYSEVGLIALEFNRALDIFSDELSKREAIASQLERLSKIDQLTGIGNRRGFDEKLNLELALSYRNHNSLSLIMIDIDYFKAYNDSYGHLLGDECLKRVSLIMRACLQRQGDFIARYGGEEFAVILPQTNAQDAELIFNSIRAKLQRESVPHASSEVSDSVTISAGIADRDGLSQLDDKDLIALADAALYCSKESGRDQSSISKS